MPTTKQITHTKCKPPYNHTHDIHVSNHNLDNAKMLIKSNMNVNHLIWILNQFNLMSHWPFLYYFHFYVEHVNFCHDVIEIFHFTN
jgi:hypothetical protein